MAFKTSIPFAGQRKEAFFVNECVVETAEIGYDCPPFETWEGSENLVLRIEGKQDGLQYPVRLTLFGSYNTEMEDREVTVGKGKNAITKVVPTSIIKGMGSAFRVLDVIQDACSTGQITEDIEVSPTGELMIDGEILSADPGQFVPFEPLVGVRLFYIRYKAKRRDGETGQNTHRRILTLREGETAEDASSRLRADFIRQVKGGFIKDYVGDLPDESNYTSKDKDDEGEPFVDPKTGKTRF